MLWTCLSFLWLNFRFELSFSSMFFESSLILWIFFDSLFRTFEPEKRSEEFSLRFIYNVVRFSVKSEIVQRKRDLTQTIIWSTRFEKKVTPFRNQRYHPKKKSQKKQYWENMRTNMWILLIVAAFCGAVAAEETRRLLRTVPIKYDAHFFFKI